MRSDSKGSKPKQKAQDSGGRHIDEINLLCRRARALAEIVAQAALGLQEEGAYADDDDHPVPWVMDILREEIARIKEHAAAIAYSERSKAA